MIVLDTNVVSEAMKPEPHRAVRAVRAWLPWPGTDTLSGASFFTTPDAPEVQILEPVQAG